MPTSGGPEILFVATTVAAIESEASTNMVTVATTL